MKLSAAISLVLALGAFALPAAAEPFTYQGSLTDNGQPADGVYDLRFVYHNTLTGGVAQLTSDQNDVSVADGVFTVTLPEPPADQTRYLELQIRDGASVGAFTTLLPRTFISATPVATRALNVEWELNSSNYLTFGDGNDVVLINRENRIGAEYFGVGADTNFFAGMYVSTTDVTGLPFYGYNAGEAFESNAYHYLDGATQTLRFNIGGNESITFTPGGDLEVNGTSRANEFEYNTPQDRYLSISGSVFTPGSDTPYLAFTSAGAGLYPNVAGGSPWYLASVNLPDGANVTQLRGYLFDNMVGPSVSLTLIRYELAATSGGADIVANVSTSGLGNSSTVRILDDNTIVGGPIDNEIYSYFVFSQFTAPTGTGDAVRLSNVRIRYTVARPD